MNDKKTKIKQYKGCRLDPLAKASSEGEVSAASGSQRTDVTHQNPKTRTKIKQNHQSCIPGFTKKNGNKAT